MQARFLLGPAGSGKTFRCLTEIRQELLASPEGPPLIFLAPKQATFQLERQLLADPVLPGYTRLQILSFERLAEFILSEFADGPPRLLAEEGRVMALRALLARKQHELKIFHATARLPGFAQQLNLLLREFQRHQILPERLSALAGKLPAESALSRKLHDLAVILRAYLDWLRAHDLQDANHLLDLAATLLKSQIANRKSQIAGGLWLDGFAEMAPQELDLLAAILPLCERATLAFCLESPPDKNQSWLSPWAVIGQTFHRCYERVVALPGIQTQVDPLPRDPDKSRFAANPVLRHLEKFWTAPEPFVRDALQALRQEPGEPKSQDTQTPPVESNHVGLSSHLRVVVCANPEAEATLAAREILRFVRGGGRFREAAVLVRHLNRYGDTLRRLFTRYEIPFFLDHRESVAHHPLAELTRYALRLGAFGWEHDDWFSALKTGLVSSDETAIDRLENEALARGWKGSAWLQPLKTPGDAELEKSINRWLGEVLPPFRQLTEALHTENRHPTGRQLAAALRELWQSLEVQRTLASWNAREISNFQSQISNSVNATVLEQMTAWLDNVELAFADAPLALLEWLPILEAGLANLTVGVIPPALDQVLIGAIDRSRNPDLQLAILLGWNEGIFPAAPAPNPLLTERERDELARQEVGLGPDARHQLGHERYYAYIACTRARQRVVITSATRDSKDNPLNASPFIGHLRRLFPGLELETFSSAIDWREAEHSSELIAPLLATVASAKSTPPHEALLPSSVLTALESLSVFADPLRKWRLLSAAGAIDRLPPALAERLYGKELRTSVSALEDFAECPFKFFAARGLHADERREFEADQRERGSFQHEILQQFHRELEKRGKRWRDLTAAEARELAGRVGEALIPIYRDGIFLADAARQFTARILIAGVQELLETLVAWMPQYGFDPHQVEMNFGLDDRGLPPWRIDLADSHALALRGRIDRIDLCALESGKALVAVIDYKSSPRSLDAIKLQCGLELQLLSYLGALHHLDNPREAFNVSALIPAGGFYVSLKPKQGSGKTRTEAREKIGQAMRSGFQHSGRFNGELLRHFDNRGESKGDQFKFAINKDGRFAKRGNDALEAQAFEKLLAEVEYHLRRIGRAIYAGDTSVAPFRKGSETACDYCDFRPFCRFDPWAEPYRALKSQRLS